MGSGSKKAPSYSSATAISPATEAAASSDVLLAGEVGQSVEAMEAGAYGHDPEGYEKFQADVLHAASLIEQAGDPTSPLFGSATEEELASLKAGLATAARHHLDDHLAEDLQRIALAQGFTHPGVFTKAGDDSPLAAWLHPLYSAETKGEIQQAALKRFFELADKSAILDTEAALAQSLGISVPAHSAPAWDLPRFQQAVAEAQSLLQDLPQNCTWPQVWSKDYAEPLGRLLDLERDIHHAVVPGADAAFLQAERDALATELDKRMPPSWGATPLYAELASKRGLKHAETLHTEQLLSWLRGKAAPEEREVVAEIAADRAARQQKLIAAAEKLDFAITSPTGSTHHAYHAISTMHQALAEAKKNVVWGPAQSIPGVLGAVGDQEVTQSFEAFSKSQSLADLRETAAGHGLKHTEVATRSQLTNWLGARWKYGWKADQKRAQIAGRLAEKADKKASVPAGATTKATAQTSFSTKVAAIAEVLAFRQQVATKVPAPLADEEFAGLQFTHDGSASALGGVHEKHFYRDQSGKRWLFKPDKTSGGAAAAAEAAAARLWRKAGLPSLEVRMKTLGGQHGCVQPLLAGAAACASDVRKLSEAEVRQLAAEHVASWALSDHDGHAQNYLKTKEGGLVRVDRGQAFRYFGTDKLDLGYHPNKTFGTPRPLHYSLYEAAAKGEVAFDPRWILPAVKAFEAIPEGQYRELLRPVAEAGVKGGKAGWLGPMRKRAAKRLGTPSIPDGEIAEEFLRTACARKASLRKDFSKFLSTVLAKPVSLAG
jgi:hypothetical protein